MSESDKPNNAVSEGAPAKSLGETKVAGTIPGAQIRAPRGETTNDETKDPERLKSEREVGQNDNTAENGGGSVAMVRRGTGPRTAMGKERSKRNSLKHGILAEATVLDGESPAEFDFLLKGLRDCFHPAGMHEDLLVRGPPVSIGANVDYSLPRERRFDWGHSLSDMTKSNGNSSKQVKFHRCLTVVVW